MFKFQLSPTYIKFFNGSNIAKIGDFELIIERYYKIISKIVAYQKYLGHGGNIGMRF